MNYVYWISQSHTAARKVNYEVDGITAGMGYKTRQDSLYQISAQITCITSAHACYRHWRIASMHAAVVALSRGYYKCDVT